MEDQITSFTLGELLNMAGANNLKGIMRECVIADRDSRMEAFRFPFRIDACIIGIVTGGESTIMCNLNEYHLRPNSLFLFGPQNIVQAQPDTQFKARVIAISTDFMQRINLDTKHLMPLYLQFAAQPYLELSAEESQTLHRFITLIESEIAATETALTPEIVGGLISATFYKIGDTLQRHLEMRPETAKPVQNRAEEYFKQFINLLGEHFKRERSVNFYARQLYITPKYLTTLIKNISGKSVSEWIDIYVILEAKTLLKYSDKSVQEIAYQLNFANQSFFGSFFKRNTGLSPSQYKAQQ